jgi:hypothetical protein
MTYEVDPNDQPRWCYLGQPGGVECRWPALNS